MPPFRKKVTNEEYRQRKWHEHTAEAIYRNGPQYNILDVCSPTRHWQERAGKENTAVWGLCLSLFFKQTRMAVVWICFILPQRIVLTKCALAMKDYIQLLYTPGNRTEQALSSIKHAQC